MMENDLRNVVLCIPNLGWLHTNLCDSIHRWRMWGASYYAPVGLKPNDHARNSCAQYFLNETAADYLWFVDHDTLPGLHAPVKLVAAQKDIISGVTPVYTEDPNTGRMETVYMVLREGNAPDGSVGLIQYIGEGIERIDACGASCLMIHRRVLESIPFPFRVRFDENGVCTMGQDISFCKTAKDADFEIFAHYDVPCGHVKDVTLR